MFDKWRERLLKIKSFRKYHLLVYLSEKEHLIFFTPVITGEFVKPFQESENIWGLATIKEFETWSLDYKKDFQKKYRQLKKFIKKENKVIYTHLSVDIKENIKSAKSNKSYNNPNTDFNFNPPGIWFSCDLAWLDYVKKSHKYIFDRKFNYKYGEQYHFRFDWNPKNAYIIDFDDLNIKKIETCDELVKFSKKYVNDSSYINKEKIKKDFDGLMICPYLGLECNDYLKNKGTYLHISDDYFLGKVSKKDRDIYWSFSWEAATGVIFKNYEKIKYKKFFD